MCVTFVLLVLPGMYEHVWDEPPCLVPPGGVIHEGAVGGAGRHGLDGQVHVNGIVNKNCNLKLETANLVNKNHSMKLETAILVNKNCNFKIKKQQSYWVKTSIWKNQPEKQQS